MEREIEDLDALIAEAGGSAHVFGASSGGALALEAAAAGSAIDTIAVWEVPYAVGDDLRSRFGDCVLFQVVQEPPPEALATVVGLDEHLPHLDQSLVSIVGPVAAASHWIAGRCVAHEQQPLRYDVVADSPGVR
ncbi:hypothetical protein GCM10029976_092820 [Kribbella albertanoniae]|nr:hypothetical protein [Kribbella albertanoniae]